ncbi:hypothetical protein LTR66_004014 [Elasticomyces elasticus]|nr:hypothetical protein LTR66_004014 [Elasticomyces elasticus]
MVRVEVEESEQALDVFPVARTRGRGAKEVAGGESAVVDESDSIESGPVFDARGTKDGARGDIGGEDAQDDGGDDDRGDDDVGDDGTVEHEAVREDSGLFAGIGVGLVAGPHSRPLLVASSIRSAHLTICPMMVIKNSEGSGRARAVLNLIELVTLAGVQGCRWGREIAAEQFAS